ncbi:unnamed protein product [Prunus armeniaca]|uniref:Uncharacterized protein n=1 Tax=Prunus armeniaca TaxID=36596 RepID=A0A6J5WDD3_PRUAR|nr:unnamed protein product [Prunus armeniaca]
MGREKGTLRATGFWEGADRSRTRVAHGSVVHRVDGGLWGALWSLLTSSLLDGCVSRSGPGRSRDPSSVGGSMSRQWYAGRVGRNTSALSSYTCAGMSTAGWSKYCGYYQQEKNVNVTAWYLFAHVLILNFKFG